MFIENENLFLFQAEENLPNVSEQDSTRQLWISVLERAILDLEYIDLRDRALAWIESRREGIGSFVWICRFYLGLDPNKARTAVLATSFATKAPTEYWNKCNHIRALRRKNAMQRKAA